MSTQFLSFIKNRQKLGYLTKGILICVFLIFFIVCPIVFVFSQSLMNENGAFTFQNYVNAFSNEDTGKAIWDSLLLAISVTGLSTLIAVPEAYLLAKTRLRKLWWLDLILIIPFMVPPYINSMGWMLFMQRNGILWRNLPFLRPLASSFYSFFGMVWIMSMHTSPFLMTMLKSAFLSFPKSLDDANDVYQKSRIKRFFKVYMPILLPNFFIGAFLVFVKALSEYGTPATFGPAIGVFTFTTMITDRMQIAPIDFGSAASLASLLVFICMLLWMLQMIIIDKKAVNLKNEGEGRYSKSIFLTTIGSVFLLVSFFFSAFIPLFTIVVSSFKKILYKNVFEPGNFTWENYQIAFGDDTGFGTGFEAIGNSFLVGIASSFIVLLLGLFFAFYSHKNKKRVLAKSVEFLDMLPQMIPNIVTGIGMIMFFNTIYKFFPAYRTVWMLIIGYSVVFLPGMVSYIKNSLVQMPSSLLEAGRVYSKNEMKVDLKILLPQALGGAFYGFAMTLIVALRELVTAKLLQPPAFYTISLFIDSQFEQGNQQAAMALAVVSVGITLALLLPLEYISTKKKGRA